MAKGSGYRTHRLRERRAARGRRLQLAALALVAAVVALAAVLGAAYIARQLTAKHPAKPDLGYVALLTIGAGESGRQPVAYLVLFNRGLGSYHVFAVPRTLLLEGPHGEYVMAGDLMGTTDFAPYVSRLIKAGIDFQVSLPYRALAALAGSDSMWVTLNTSIGLRVGDAVHDYGGRFSLPTTAIPDVLSADGQKGPEEAAMSVAVLRALLQTAALSPADARSAAVERAAGLASDAAVRARARALLAGLVDETPLVERLPSHGLTAEGQFAFRPDMEQMMAQVTRWAPRFQSQYTVLVRNGNGDAGVGSLVVRRLAVLDVNLPTPGNATSFDYSETQILAGSDALAVAQDIRAILGHGVVLAGGDKVPPATVVVIVGKDLRTKDLR
jgi:hypothetical protein